MISNTVKKASITLPPPQFSSFQPKQVHGASQGPRFSPANPPHITRSDVAPVVRLSAADAASAASALVRSIERHWESIEAMIAAEAAGVPVRRDVIDQITQTACEPDPSDQVGLMLFGGHRSYGELWDGHISDTIDIAKGIAKYCSLGVTGALFGYQLDQKMVGLLAMDPAMPVVRYVCSHPGTQNAAGALFQSAVRYSASCGWNGELALFSYENAIPAYEALGFVQNDNQAKQLLKTTNCTTFDDQYMMLRPADSDKWRKVNGEWTLKSTMHKRFILALGSASEGGMRSI